MLANVGGFDERGDVVVQLAHDLAWRLRRHQRTDPEVIGRVLEPLLLQRRNLGHQHAALGRAGGERGELAGVDDLLRLEDEGEVAIGAAAHHFGQRLAYALGVHVDDFRDAGGEAEALERHVRRAADAGVGADQLAGIRLRRADEVLDGLVLLRLHDQHRGDRRHGRHRLQLVDFQHVGLQERRYGEGRGVHHDDVAVGLGAGHVLRADQAAGAELVLDDHRLPPLLLQLVGEDARHGVGSAAGRDARYEGDALRRELLGLGAQ